MLGFMFAFVYNYLGECPERKHMVQWTGKEITKDCENSGILIYYMPDLLLKRSYSLDVSVHLDLKQSPFKVVRSWPSKNRGFLGHLGKCSLYVLRLPLFFISLSSKGTFLKYSGAHSLSDIGWFLYCDKITRASYCLKGLNFIEIYL